MEKRVVIINDELGTIALGFSRTGYEISAIYVDCSDKNAINICGSNWGNYVYSVNWNDCSVKDFIDTDFIAGKIVLPDFSTNEKGRIGVSDNNNILKIIELLMEKRPSLFMFQCNRVNPQSGLCKYFFERLVEIGYCINYNRIDVRLITGLPVNEKTYFIYGTLNSNNLKLEALKDVYTVNYSIDDFYMTKNVDNEWYYRVNPKYLLDMERNSNHAILCWVNKHYKESRYISWNPRMVPLIVQGDEVRKITHKEIARLKGIPDEYYLGVKNKSWLYQKLMYCANVQIVQQMVSAINFDMGERSFQSREVSKGLQFENIIKTYFKNKQFTKLKLDKNYDDIIDFQLDTSIGGFSIILKIYSNNVGIETKILVACDRFSGNRNIDSEECIFIVGNIVSEEFKERVKQDYNVYIWDVKNLLWLFEEYPQIKSQFVSLLSYTVSDIEPKKPELDLFEPRLQPLYNIDLQERLRKIPPGKESAKEYEKLCVEIITYIFSEDLEFFEEQKQSNDGLYRFDYCGKIKHGNLNEFFDTVQNFFNTKYIVFEFKNYSGEITQKEIYTTEKYLYEKALRKVAVILSRKGADVNAHKAIRGCLRESGKLIVCLSDENINKLIDIKNSTGAPCNMLEEVLDDMLMDLEK